MSEKDISTAASKERGLVVKNKKYNKTDLIAFAICLLAALVIWIHATNVRYHEEHANAEPPAPPAESQTEQST